MGSQADKACRAAPLTAPGHGGIAVVALSGSRTPDVLSRVFRPAAGGPLRRSVAASRLVHGFVVRGEERIDEVLLAVVGPGTRQAELHCHGGAAALREVLLRLEEAGAVIVAADSIATAFERREGLDPIRADARRALVQAPTRLAARVLLHQWSGVLSEELACLADLLETLRTRPGAVGQARAKVAALIDTYELGRSLLEPKRIAIVGRSNAGKSTLLNALLGWERIIVHPEPGTTRDAVEETLDLEGVPFRVVDTAGIRHSAAGIERIGGRRALRMLQRSDYALLVIDGSEQLTDEDRFLLGKCQPETTIVLCNKSDLEIKAGLQEIVGAGHAEPLEISAKERTGLDALQKSMLVQFAAWTRCWRQPWAVVFTADVHEMLVDIAESLERASAQPAECEREIALHVSRLKAAVTPCAPPSPTD